MIFMVPFVRCENPILSTLMVFFRHAMDQNQKTVKLVHLIIDLVNYLMEHLNVNTNRNTIDMPEKRKKKKLKMNCDVMMTSYAFV